MFCISDNVKPCCFHSIYINRVDLLICFEFKEIINILKRYLVKHCVTVLHSFKVIGLKIHTDAKYTK